MAVEKLENDDDISSLHFPGYNRDFVIKAIVAIVFLKRIWRGACNEPRNRPIRNGVASLDKRNGNGARPDNFNKLNKRRHIL